MCLCVLGRCCFILSRKNWVWCHRLQLKQTPNETEIKNKQKSEWVSEWESEKCLCYHRIWSLRAMHYKHSGTRYCRITVFSVEQISFTAQQRKKENVFIFLFPFFSPLLFAYSALTACICNKCVWLWFFFFVSWYSGVFSLIHLQKCIQNWAY